jgi:hypothetical protein
MNYFDSDENYDYHEEEDDNEEQLFDPSSSALSAAERNS